MIDASIKGPVAAAAAVVATYKLGVDRIILRVLFIGLVLLLFWTWSKKRTGVTLNEPANAGF